MIVDFDDFHEHNHRLDLLHALKDANPDFRCTLFAVPGLGSAEFWESVPGWCELAMHGWKHPDPYEASTWTREGLLELMEHPLLDEFTNGFKAPGWQISDGCYEALLEAGWWVADQHLEDHRRPAGLRTYFYEDDPVNRFHGHIGWNGSGNAIEENFAEILHRVRNASSFELVSEVAQPWGVERRLCYCMDPRYDESDGCPCMEDE